MAPPLLCEILGLRGHRGQGKHFPLNQFVKLKVEKLSIYERKVVLYVARSKKQPTTQKSYYNLTKKSMETLGFYRVEYEPLISIYGGMLHQYDQYSKQLENEGFDPTEVLVNTKGVVSEKKSPLVSTMETLRKDILAYSDRLCLNPKALSDEKNRQDKNQPQGLENILDSIWNDDA